VLDPNNRSVALEMVPQAVFVRTNARATTARSHADLPAMLIRTFANSLLPAEASSPDQSAPLW
jgi:hypothetical protein